LYFLGALVHRNSFDVLEKNHKGVSPMAKILIVDDDATFRSIVTDFLEMNGYECVVAGSVAQARRQLKRNHFQLIVSDLNMPLESGLDLLSYVLSGYPFTPFIMMTASYDEEARSTALRLGASAYLTKPFRLNEFLASVMKAIGKCTAFDLPRMLWSQS
jgi:DNA-binding response OmpR family regulator